MMFGLLITVIVLLGIALAIWMFERRRAEGIEHDLRDQASQGPGPLHRK